MKNPRRIGVLMATAFVDMIGFSILFPLLPFYAERLNAEEWVIGWMIAIFSIMQLVFAPMWGRFSDRYGRRPALLLGLAISAVAFTIFAFSTTIWLLFLTRLVQGIAGATVGVVQAYVGDASAPEERAKAFGWLTAATSAGVMVGPIIGSLAFGFGAHVPGLVAAALCLINLMFAARWLPESSKPKSAAEWSREKASGRQSIRSAALDVLLKPRGQVSRLIWIYAVGMLGFMSMTAVMPLYLGDRFGITEVSIGPFFAMVGGLGIVMRAIVLGRMVDRFGETKVMRIGAVFLATGLLTIPMPNVVWGTTLCMALVPVGTALLFPTTSAQVSHGSLQGEMGQTLGVQQFFGGMSRVVAPIWATAAYGAFGATQPFYVAAFLVGIVAALTFGVKAPVRTESGRFVPYEAEKDAEPVRG